MVLDDYSRAVAGYFLSFEAPSAAQTALALRQAIWRKQDPGWHVCGIPEILYSDNGSDFTSQHLEQVGADLKMQLVFSTPGIPRGRGRIEQAIGKLKRFKRIAMRCERTAESFAAFVAFACGLILVKSVHRA